MTQVRPLLGSRAEVNKRAWSRRRREEGDRKVRQERDSVSWKSRSPRWMQWGRNPEVAPYRLSLFGIRQSRQCRQR